MTNSNTQSLKRVLDSKAAYAILDSAIPSGVTWMQGGCAILAQALHKVFGYPVYVVYNNLLNQAEHLVVEVAPGKYMDYETIDAGREYTKEEMLSGELFERLPNLSLIPFRPDINFTDIIFDDKASEAIAKLIKEKMRFHPLINMSIGKIDLQNVWTVPGIDEYVKGLEPIRIHSPLGYRGKSSRTLEMLRKYANKTGRKVFVYDGTIEMASGGPVTFISVPVSELTTSLKDFQGRAEAYSSTTYNRIINEVADGSFNFSALPAIQIWKDSRTGKWVILAGHSRTAAFTDLSQGKHPIDAKFSKEDFAKIHAQVVEAETLEEAKKIAQQSNLAGVQSDIDFAGYMRQLRPQFKTKAEYWQKLDDLFGANKIFINELSYLNPDGKTMSMLRQLSGITDKAQRAEIDKIASYIGAIREKLPVITDQHENEIYDWLHHNLNSDRAKEKLSSKANVVGEIASRVSRMFFDPEQPLNLENIGTKTYIEQDYETKLAEKKKLIEEKQKEYRDTRDRYFAEKVPIEKIEELLTPQDKYILRLQSEYRDLLLKKSEVQQANKTILGLFDAPASPPAASHQDKKEFENKLKTLLSMLRLSTDSASKAVEPKPEAPKYDWRELAKTLPPMYGKSPFAPFRILKYQVDIPTMKVVAYDYPSGKFEAQTTQFYENFADKFSLEPPAGYKPFRSEILNADYDGPRVFQYALFPPFLLDQLDWWLSEFENRYLKKITPITTRWNFVPQEIREKYGYHDVEMLKQVLETAIHIFTDYLIKTGTDDKQTYDRILNFYEHQPTIKWRSSNSLLLQQYSTPVPIAYLISRFCIPTIKFGDRYLEPSAGTGLLTIGTPPAMWTVNEFDKDRLLCLQFMGFKDTHNLNSNRPLPFEKVFDAMITNPPFGTDVKEDFDGYKIKKLEHRMAAYALRCMKDTGKAGIIIGGGGYDTTKLYDQKTGMMLPYETDRVFFSWLYKFYNVVDIIHVDGFLYSRMGAAAPIRIILIDGESRLGGQSHPYFLQDIEHLAPEHRNSIKQIHDYGVLFQRFYSE